MYLKSITFIQESIEFTINNANSDSFFILIKKENIKLEYSVGYISINEVEILQNKCEINKLIKKIISSCNKSLMTQAKIDELIKSKNLLKYSEQIIKNLINLDIYNDENYARYFIKNYVKNKRYAIRKAKELLTNKKVSEEQIELIISELKDDQDQVNKTLLIEGVTFNTMLSIVKSKKKIRNVLVSYGYELEETDFEIADDIDELDRIERLVCNKCKDMDIYQVVKLLRKEEFDEKNIEIFIETWKEKKET